LGTLEQVMKALAESLEKKIVVWKKMKALAESLEKKIVVWRKCERGRAKSVLSSSI
jgi:hypothetical protein